LRTEDEKGNRESGNAGKNGPQRQPPAVRRMSTMLPQAPQARGNLPGQAF
jgi:hypothetical protein